VLDEGDQVISDYPFAAAFDRAIRVESPAHLHLPEDSDTIFTALRAVISGIVRQAEHEGALSQGLDPASAADAVYALFRGLYDQAATAAPQDYHAAVDASKMLLRGSLFDFTQPPR
jgi:hypothetical protein